MKHLILILSIFTIVITSCAATGQMNDEVEKRTLSHDDFDIWQDISRETLSRDGRFLLYELNPQEGDGDLIIRDFNDEQIDSLHRGGRFELSYNDRTIAFFLATPYEKEREAKIEEKNPNEEFDDTLAVYQLDTGELEKIPEVDSYKMPEKSGKWLAYHFDRDLENDEVEDEEGEENNDEYNETRQDEPENNDETETDLILRNLETGEEEIFHHVQNYHFSKHGERLVFETGKEDSLELAGIHVYDLNELTQTTISSEKADYSSIAMDSSATQIAFVADPDTVQVENDNNNNDEPDFYSLYYWSSDFDEAELLADETSDFLPEEWMINEWANPSFSEDESRLFFGTAPEPMRKDTTVEEIDMAEVDVWHWQDERLQPRQLIQKQSDLQNTFRAVYHIEDEEFIQLADEEMENISVPDRGNARYAIGSQNRHYLHMQQWKGFPVYQDVYVVDVTTGEREMIMDRVKITTTQSPDGNFLLYYDYKDKNWYTYHFESGEKANLTEDVEVPFYDELNDRPDDPSPYGISGWTENDRHVLINDRYDIWVFDPANDREPYSLTGETGRDNEVVYRYINLDRDERHLPEEELYLSGFHDEDKSNSFHRTDLDQSRQPEQLWHGDYRASTPVKADEEEMFMLSLSTFQDYPDLYITDMDFTSLDKVTEANPQQDRYLWGDVELFQFNSTNGDELDGLLYTPENFDPDKQYPMIIYFYERTSDRLHWHRVPAPSASTITPAFYTSRGYVVAMPDIVYEEGYPGRSAERAVNGMATHLIDQGFVDRDRIALQGQSWGEYQIAHIITRTDMYRAAMAGAPVSNMTSAYGGIRWGSGLNRQFQYERTQSRIGKSLWERPRHYIENSPLFYAEDVNTPLLMMHNDDDGAVPWYQGIEFFTALKRLGEPVWMLNYNDEAHNLRERVNRKDLSRRMQQFFDHYLMDEPMPVWMKHGVPAVEKGKHQGFELVNPTWLSPTPEAPNFV